MTERSRTSALKGYPVPEKIMTVKELIETNACIVEAYITLRGDYFGNKFEESVYVHEFGIGTYASFGRHVESTRREMGRGKRGSKFKEKCTLINKEINLRAKNHYWGIMLNAFPKNILDLEVTSWSTSDSYSWKIYKQSTGYESACVIRIECWLPPDNVKEIIVKAEVKAVEQLDGQMDITDFTDVMP